MTNFAEFLLNEATKKGRDVLQVKKTLYLIEGDKTATWTTKLGFRAPIDHLKAPGVLVYEGDKHGGFKGYFFMYPGHPNIDRDKYKSFTPAELEKFISEGILKVLA